MDRRTFLKSSGAATVGGLATTAAAKAKEVAPRSGSRTLSIATTSTLANEDAALIVRRFSEAVEAATGAALNCVATDIPETSDIVLASILDHIGEHPAWSTLLPLVNGLDHLDFAGWLVAGGGTPIIEQLEAETQQKILLVGARPAPHGLWADRELFGLHPRPSLSIDSGTQTVLSHHETGTARLTCLLSDGLVADLEANRLNDLILHALPTRLAGEPLAFTMPQATWDALTPAERTSMTTRADASFAQSITENRVTARLAETTTPLPTPVPLPDEFQLALTAAVDAERARLASASDLAADSLASQAAFRTMMRASDLTKVRRPLAS